MKQCTLSIAVLAACFSVSSCSSQIPVSNGKPIIVPMAKPKMVRASTGQHHYPIKKAVSQDTRHNFIRTQYQTKSAVRPQYRAHRPDNNTTRHRNHVNPYEVRGALSFPRLSKHELNSIGHQIFLNESGGSINKLVHWNRNEEFASLGIGHWTWYPRGSKSHRYGNSFPKLLSFMESNGVRLPGWLQRAKRSGAPWKNRAEFLKNKNSAEVRQLKDLLHRHRDLQTEYIVQRAQRALPRMVKSAPGYKRQHVENNLRSLLRTPAGRYTLIDYINFKGEGLGKNRSYGGNNWGALQVLLAMNSQRDGRVTHAFANAAMDVLKRRVRHSPSHRQEHKWLAGWNRRVDTYRYFRV